MFKFNRVINAADFLDHFYFMIVKKRIISLAMIKFGHEGRVSIAN